MRLGNGKRDKGKGMREDLICGCGLIGRDWFRQSAGFACWAVELRGLCLAECQEVEEEYAHDTKFALGWTSGQAGMRGSSARFAAGRLRGGAESERRALRRRCQCEGFEREGVAW